MYPYNRDLLNGALKVLGKSLVILTGVGYGVIKAMDVLAEDVIYKSQISIDKSKGKHTKGSPPDPSSQRLEGIEQRLIRMEKSIEALTLARDALKAEAPKSQPEQQRGEHFITRAELERAIERLSDDINSDIAHRFEVQNRSVQSLRSMIARTDELLEHVIENIESATLTAQ